MKCKICGWGGCNKLITSGYYCDKHRAMAEKNRAKPFENAHRYTEAYQSKEWRQFRASVLRQTPYCEQCGGTDGLQVHHKIPVRNAPGLFLERSNVVVLCRTCHQQVTAAEIRMRREK